MTSSIRDFTNRCTGVTELQQKNDLLRQRIEILEERIKDFKSIDYSNTAGKDNDIERLQANLLKCQEIKDRCMAKLEANNLISYGGYKKSKKYKLKKHKSRRKQKRNKSKQRY